MTTGMTENIANFVVATGYEHIPREAIGITKNAILDCIGVTIAGSNEPAVNITAEQAKPISTADEAGVICRDFRTSADLAAWINGVASHVLDYDDTFTIEAGYNMHPTVPILPAVLALGEKCDSSGSDILTAYTIGIEVESRLGAVMGRYASDLGWHPTPVLGSIGAAAACAKILKLDAQQIRTSLGIASSMAGGLFRNFGTMAKSLHAGNAARAGIVAALLAKNGFTADTSLMEGKFGFLDMFSGGKVIEPTSDEPDNKWDIVSKGMTFKPYPCCRGTHPSIDAVLYLRNNHEIPADRVTTITCKTKSTTRRILKYDHPKTGLEAKFSVQYCIAAALLRGKISLEDFTNEKVNDPATQELISRIGYSHPKEYERGYSLTQEVVVKLNDGTEYAHKVTVPKGEPGNPMTDEELRAKFTDCAHLYFPQNKIDKILDILTHLEYIHSISGLMELLTYKTS